MKTVEIHTNPSYPIFLDTQLLNSDLFLQMCKELACRFVIITDERVKSIYGNPLMIWMRGNDLNVELLAIPAGESNKTREVKQQLEDQMFALQCGRDTCVIALGGGVVTDLAGFVAATYCRGIPVIYFPTTLLAMADACIGGKTGVNTPYGKNLIGSFSQPHAVFMDITTLQSLSLHELKNGVVEIIKHGLLMDIALFNQLRDNAHLFFARDESFLLQLIYQSSLIKKFIVEQDEKESGLRQLLNLGHTFGHAIEAASGFSIGHGEAVALGLVAEGLLAVKLGILEIESFKQIKKIIDIYMIPSELAQLNLPRETIFEYLFSDKKNKNKQAHFVFLKQIGEFYQQNSQYSTAVDAKLIREVLYDTSNDLLIFNE
jgi:3-dehydroquinate synthase